ncbi:MAG: nucleoside recognition protein [Clostridiales bacterium]|nr:nucleoside recognition protein [Clostridiales bacterium]
MLNILWATMMVIGVGWGMATGRMEAVTNGALDSVKEAVSLCITMLGVMSLWTGLMEVARQGNIIKKLTKGIAPFVNWMFPDVPNGDPAKEHITTNIIANILGLGWAATPAGLKAMESLRELNNKCDKTNYINKKNDNKNCDREKNLDGCREASDAMCTFLILNISSLQLIPVNMIAYRAQYGSVNPAGIIAPGLIATFISTMIGILFCKIMYKYSKSHRKIKELKGS